MLKVILVVGCLSVSSISSFLRYRKKKIDKKGYQCEDTDKNWYVKHFFFIIVLTSLLFAINSMIDAIDSSSCLYIAFTAFLLGNIIFETFIKDNRYIYVKKSSILLKGDHIKINEIRGYKGSLASLKSKLILLSDREVIVNHHQLRVLKRIMNNKHKNLIKLN